MKILKKAKFIPCECVCGTIYLPSKKDLRPSGYVYCPVCNYPQKPKYDKEADNEQREAD